jgi:hypothetical protein
MSTKDTNDWVSMWSEVGRSWSKYGRTMGKVALENLADVLKKTAQALETPEDASRNQSAPQDPAAPQPQTPKDKS